jgi:hypothetical protein
MRNSKVHSESRAPAAVHRVWRERTSSGARLRYGAVMARAAIALRVRADALSNQPVKMADGTVGDASRCNAAKDRRRCTGVLR